MKDYQKKVDEWVTQHKIGYWKPFEIMTHITEEVGELAREVSTHPPQWLQNVSLQHTLCSAGRSFRVDMQGNLVLDLHHVLQNVFVLQKQW